MGMILLNGPGQWGHRGDLVKAFAGPCQLITAWRKHRAELMAACPPGRRPYGFWFVERRLKITPLGEAAQLRAIRALQA